MKKIIIFLLWSTNVLAQDSSSVSVGVKWLFPTDRASKNKDPNAAPVGEAGNINGSFSMCGIFTKISTQPKIAVYYGLHASQDRLETSLSVGLSYDGAMLAFGSGCYARRMTGGTRNIHGLSSDYQYGRTYSAVFIFKKKIDYIRVNVEISLSKDQSQKDLVHQVFASAALVPDLPEFFWGIRSENIWGTGPLFEYRPIRDFDTYGFSYVFPKKDEESLYKRTEGFFVHYSHSFK